MNIENEGRTYKAVLKEEIKRMQGEIVQLRATVERLEKANENLESVVWLKIEEYRQLTKE